MQIFFHTIVRILRRAFPPQRRALAAGAGSVLLLILLSVAVYAAVREEQPPVLVQTGASDMVDDEAGSGYTLIQPELLSGSSSTMLLGSVLSNDIANIYPRRDGIVEDIYVDIGDHVEKNQVIALLLPKGVEGQSAAMIAEKNARKDQAESDLTSAQIVAEQTMSNAQQKIAEKETELTVAQHEQQAMLEKFAELNAQVSQMREQAFTTARSARQLIEQVLTGSNSRSGEDIQEEDILRQLGLLDTQMRYAVAPQFTQLDHLEKEWLSADEHRRTLLIEEIIATVDSTLSTTVSLLGSTPSVLHKQPGVFTQEELAMLTKSLLDAQQRILMAKEKLQDAQIALETLSSSEPELARAYRSGEHQDVQSNRVRMLAAQLDTARNGLELTDANQQQMIERQRSMLNIADAMFQVEVAGSGNRKILSPFTGTVSKRFIEVGQIVMPSMSAFELVDVPTSLAKKAKQEIQFGLPERQQAALALGDEVTFFLPEDGTKTYKATVTRKSPQVDRETHTVIVLAKIDDELDLPHRTSVRIRIVDTSTPLFLVPSFAVKRDDARNYIWTMNPESKIPERLYVNVHAEDGESAEITGDLTEETAVLLDPPEVFMHLVSNMETDDFPQAP